MTTKQNHTTGRSSDLFQWIGLALLIAFTYRHFGPQAKAPVTPTVIGIYAASVCLLLGVNPFKSRQ